MKGIITFKINTTNRKLNHLSCEADRCKYRLVKVLAHYKYPNWQQLCAGLHHLPRHERCLLCRHSILYMSSHGSIPGAAPWPPPSWLLAIQTALQPFKKKSSQCYLHPLPFLCPVYYNLFFVPMLKIKREMKTHLFSLFFFQSRAFQLTKIHIYANMRHLFPPLPHMGDGSRAWINDIASAVMFAAFH